ncbi:hypothetical protein SE17_02305 [Kouleothrix aurantiaca]|uniref:Phage tail protein n=1 Tax=Kouleothrix aurantiaca TaxID=186479 RepID=A0A0P9HIK1_9CHLR|nr:hypothetical protein SE17_02305 [Kouleothrix aurantiaca]
MALLSRADILQALDLPRERVAVPEWGGEVYVRALNGSERDSLEAWMLEMNGKGAQDLYANFTARLAAMTMVGEDGENLFTLADIQVLGKKSANALRRVMDVAQRLSGVTQADVEELTKNSASDQSDDSGSV